MINVRRVGTGLGVAAVVIGILVVDVVTGTRWATSVLIALMLCQALREAYGLLRQAGLDAAAGVAVPATFVLLMMRAAAEPLGLSPGEARTALVVGLASLMVAPLVVSIARGPSDEGPQSSDLAAVGAVAFPLAWVALLGSFLLELRLIPGEALHDVPRGLGLCFTVVACVKIGDSAAYFVGNAIGRHPMCWVSPKKTWEGALASVIGAIAVAVLLGVWLGEDARLMAGLGLVSNLAGQGGDLLESFVKRAAGAKDSATSFGEMGGVLDMLDAPLLAAPAAYLWCDLLVVRGLPV